MNRTLAIVALTALAACGPVDGPANITFDGARYHLVTGKDLSAAFKGKKIRYPDPQRIGDVILTSSVRCDGFYPDGRYRSCSDRAPRIDGKFQVFEDRVCMTVYEPSRCYQLYRSRDGLYLLGHPGEQPQFEPISFVSAADDTVPPLMR